MIKGKSITEALKVDIDGCLTRREAVILIKCFKYCKNHNSETPKFIKFGWWGGGLWLSVELREIKIIQRLMKMESHEILDCNHLTRKIPPLHAYQRSRRIETLSL